MAQSLFEKIWASHVVTPETDDTPAVLYIDLHLLHEVTTPQAFDLLRAKGLPVRRTDRCLATLDHSTPTVPVTTLKDLEVVSEPSAAKQVRQMEKNCKDFGIELRGFGSRDRGIVHVMGPELGATQPGATIVCGDSHTSTHGAFGALAFGIGTTEVGHVLATQCLLQRKPKTLAINVEGALPADVTAKDLILAIIGKIGVGGGTGHVIEYRGSAIRALSMEQRMTICNMSIEAGARAGMVAPDDTTYQYMAGRPLAPQGAKWDAAVAKWRQLPSDAGARFDKEVTLDASKLKPMVTFGTNPGMVIPIDGVVPQDDDPAFRKALAYMRVEAGKPLLGTPVDVVFIGSCTNGRLSDIRAAAKILRGRRVADRVRLLVVPGSAAVKREAEAEGLDEVVRAAGGEWREPGCSMCIGMNGDTVPSGKLSVSTSNRNFEGRQGAGARTVLASPVTAAAAAVKGAIADPREFAG
ncbi:MAG TPA: 3-isopropylmalate dehydratase large subunit [Gammaproteobacteria bacterium]|jgi:3-isopropylmalate/(R)-2-methylmalate dehydratase large subunit|nr:3-isopropylmalate dehydratase large subunit [Gammaproteobacteria bacterium]